MTVMSVILTLFSAFVFTEVAGYFIHILLHSESVPFLSKGHMLHHLRDYGPKRSLRDEVYVSSATGRWNIAGNGIEWMAPIGFLVGIMLSIFNFVLDLSAATQILFISASIGWGMLMFGYMHSAMHLKNFWMLKVPGLRIWFLHARKLHDIHHLELADDGRMLKNYGICFFMFDRLFGTISNKHGAFNHPGFDAALKRYSYIFK